MVEWLAHVVLVGLIIIGCVASVVAIGMIVLL